MLPDWVLVIFNRSTLPMNPEAGITVMVKVVVAVVVEAVAVPEAVEARAPVLVSVVQMMAVYVASQSAHAVNRKSQRHGARRRVTAEPTGGN